MGGLISGLRLQMTDKNWKRHERETAKAFNSVRTGPTGKDNADIIAWNGNLLIECKQRKSLPKWLKDAISQVQGYVAQSGNDSLGIVILHETGQRHSTDYVVMQRDDFLNWFGE